MGAVVFLKVGLLVPMVLGNKILLIFKGPFPGRQDLFCSFSNSHTQRLSCFLVAGLNEWAIVVSESRFLTFENKVSVKPKHKKKVVIFFLRLDFLKARLKKL